LYARARDRYPNSVDPIARDEAALALPAIDEPEAEIAVPGR
jgi:hypothetical protein